jgi:C4-dicarboxylate transporter, DctM subunit
MAAPTGRKAQATWAESARAFRESIWGLMLVGIIYTGVFTATEAAAMSAMLLIITNAVLFSSRRSGSTSMSPPAFPGSASPP